MTSTTTSPASRKQSKTDILVAAIACLGASIFSVEVQGFHYGINNNLFHVPIALDWQHDPVFAGDHFVQSLRYFVSGLWPLLSLLTSEDGIGTLFFALHLGGRWLSLVALTWAAAALGVRSRPALVFVPFWLALVLAVMPTPKVGGAEIFTNYFTHTPLALPLFIASLILAVRHCSARAVALTGVIANLNAFVAVWTGLVALSAAGRSSLKQVAIGLGTAAVLALPIAFWIYTALAEQTALPSADYVAFLRAYFPDHFFIDACEPREVLQFIAILLAGLAAWRLLDAEAAWTRGYLALCLLMVLGAALPYVTQSRLLLDLQLLRASGLAQTLGVLAATVLAVSYVQGPPRQRLAGAVALCLMALLQQDGLVQAVILLAAIRLDDRRWDVVLGVVALAVGVLVHADPALIAAQAVIVLGFLAARPLLETWGTLRVGGILSAVAIVGIAVGATASLLNRDITLFELPDAQEAARWARQSTAPNAIFLLAPTERPHLTVPFQLVSRRRVWIDWKRGAAALWQPSYYYEWNTRLSEVRALRDVAARLDYACVHRIDYVLDGRKLRAPIRPVFENHEYQIFAARDWCR